MGKSEDEFWHKSNLAKTFTLIDLHLKRHRVKNNEITEETTIDNIPFL